MKTWLLTTLTAAVAASAFATTTANANNYHGSYVGAKVGQSLTTDIAFGNGTVQTDKATQYGVYGGYTGQNHVGFELAYSQTADTDVTANDIKIGEASTNTLGLYATYAVYPERMGPFYLKGKLGVVRADTEITPIAGAKLSEDDTGIGVGVGVGYDFTPHFSVEGEYNYAGVNEDMSDIGIGLKFKF